MNNKREPIGYVKIILCTCFLVLCTLVAIYFKQNGISSTTGSSSASTVASERLTVCFVDSGQSDCTIIKTNKKTVLIDVGQASDYEKISDALHSYGVTKIDLFIATHPHSDHIGSAQKVLENYKVATLLVPNIPEEFMPKYSLYEGMIAAAEQAETEIVKAEVGKKYTLGSGIYLSVLGPCGNYYSDLNSWSIVTRLTFGKYSFLFVGDIEEIAEKDLLNSGAELSSTVLKVGHHGSKSSTSTDFLSKVSPKYAVITCGVGNDYGHPHSETLTKLKDCDAKIFRTDINGRIVFTTKGSNLNTKTEK